MSMEEWPDDHLDKLFRKSAEEFDVPVNPDDWTDMERRLDEHDRHMLFDWISRWGGIGALLLLGGISWVTYDGKPTVTQQQLTATVRTPAQTSPPRLPAALQEKMLSNKNGVRTNGPVGQVATKIPERQLVSLAGGEVGRAADAVASVPYSQLVRRQSRPVSRVDPPVMAQTGRQPNRHLLRTRIFSGAVSGTLPMPMGYPTPVGNVPGKMSGSQPDEAAQFVVNEVVADSKWIPAIVPATSLSGVVQQVRSIPEPTFPEQNGAVDAPVQQAVPRLSRLSVMVFASPDLSSIGLKNFDRPGSNAGLAIQYQLTDRLSINTAAMYSVKRYQTAASEYVWPSYMTMDVWPNEIGGTCKMIDIPLNVRYDWLLRPRGDGRAPARWFASVGLTSYFIQRETYVYDYEYPDNPKIKYRGWDNQKAGRPGGSFGFSNLNLSVGYEQPISRRLSWQVEPFIKIPVQQVGYFRVKLLSTGAFLGLRYRL